MIIRKSIQDFVSRIAKVRSEAILKQLRAALAGDIVEQGPWQEACGRIDGQVQAAQRLAVQLMSADAMEEAQRLIEGKTEVLEEVSQQPVL